MAFCGHQPSRVLGISRPTVVDAIRRTYARWLFRLSTKVVHRGVTIGVLWPTAADHRAVERVKDALDLLAVHAPIQLKRLRDLVHGVSIWPGGPAGSYLSAARHIAIRCSEHLDASIPSATRIACTLAHEATHAYLASRGIRATDSNRHRVEYICYRAEIALARRLPDSDSIIENAEFALTQPASFWSAEVRRQVDADHLRELGVPEIFVSAFIRLSRLMSRRPAAELAVAPVRRDGYGSHHR
jgi:hypothetical protein